MFFILSNTNEMTLSRSQYHNTLLGIDKDGFSVFSIGVNNIFKSSV